MSPFIYGRRKKLIGQRQGDTYWLTSSLSSLYRPLPAEPPAQVPVDDPLTRGLTVRTNGNNQP